MRTCLIAAICLSCQLCQGGNEADVAAKVDAALNRLLTAEGATLAASASDEDFLRRVSLDLAGVIPTPQEVTLFGLNGESGKRSQKINELLDTQEFGQIWGAYWKAVVVSRATEQRVRLAERGFEAWFVDQFNANRPWDEITRELITANGLVTENGETGLIFAHTGDPAELASEISRIFMGIQMSCANCHDHPTDAWKREQFHQLAAFLPRITVRRENPQDQRSFMVTSLDEQQERRREFDPVQLLRAMDRNRDGKLAKSEARGPLQERFDRALEVADADKDRMLSADELKNLGGLMNNNQPGRGSSEYFMPDLQDPSSQGTLIQPVFFVEDVKGPLLKTGASDMARRHALVDYITAPSNPWFARAFINRVWSEMLGSGFYMPIDDMGPERTPFAPEALEILVSEFVASGYDVKWLYRTIAHTEAYQRALREEELGELPFASARPTRLRSDQIYNAVQQVLGVSSLNGAPAARGRFGGMDPGRTAFAGLFSFDASTPQEDIIGNVPQALFMMNSTQLENLLSGDRDTRLGRLLRRYDNDLDALDELYLLVLSRSPTAREIEINQTYIAEVDNRTEAFEDIMWSLLNSTEFLSKR